MLKYRECLIVIPSSVNKLMDSGSTHLLGSTDELFAVEEKRPRHKWGDTLWCVTSRSNPIALSMLILISLTIHFVSILQER